MRKVAALILAAGRATRFGGPASETKLSEGFNGRPLVRHVAEAALASRASPAGLVTGHAADKVVSVLAGLDLFIVHNGAYAEGLSTSLKAGVAALPPEVRGVLILLADMPLVTHTLIDRLIAAFETQPVEPDAVVPVRNGRRGNPILIGRNLFAEIAELRGDHGAKPLLKNTGLQIVECPTDDPAVEIDVDTRAVLDQLRKNPAFPRGNTFS